MANLIIKPTSGGSLILQDEGGTAAHTIDASGNHTLSGTTNNLGTVAATTTFPSLMPVKVKSTTKVDTFTTTDHTTDGVAITGLSVTTDVPKSSSSKFLIMIHIGCMSGSGGSGALHLVRTPAGGSATQVGGATTSGNHNGQIARGAGNWNGDSNHTASSFGIFYLDSPSSSVAVTYAVHLEAQSGQTYHIGRSHNNEGNDAEQAYAGYASSSITVMEVQ